jgi:hypothetical protein
MSLAAANARKQQVKSNAIRKSQLQKAKRAKEQELLVCACVLGTRSFTTNPFLETE